MEKNRTNIILVGYMGCGKTTVGKNLARICGYTFLDTDERIEEKQGRSISDIFATDGENAFRDMETECIREMLEENLEGMVISTGGGMVLREENRKLLKELGIVVLLKIEPETVYDRIKGDTKRPLLQCEDPLTRIREMMLQRAEYYEKAAHEIVQVDGKKQQEIAELIFSICNNKERKQG